MGKRGRPIIRPCGTVAAYQRHYKNGERPCQACRNAYYAYERTLRPLRKMNQATKAIAYLDDDGRVMKITVSGEPNEAQAATVVKLLEATR